MMSKSQGFSDKNDANSVASTNSEHNGMRVLSSTNSDNDTTSNVALADSESDAAEDNASANFENKSKQSAAPSDFKNDVVRNAASINPQSDDGHNIADAISKSNSPRNVVFINPGKKTGREIAIVILCVAVVVLMLLLCLRFFACSSDVYDSNAKEGMTPNKTEDEIREAMARKIEEGKFAISIYSVLRFPDGASEGEANIANVPNNNYDMQVTIIEDATGDVLYESGIIKPNSYVDKIKLNKDLDAGTYEATATFHALDKETHKESGMTNAKIEIDVEN